MTERIKGTVLRWVPLIGYVLALCLAGCGGKDETSADSDDGRARRTATVNPGANATGSGGSESVYSEAGKLIRTDESLVALGNELFGDRVGMYQGSLEFVQSDVSLAGNSGLPVSVGRKHSAPVTLDAYNPGGGTAGHFGDWELEIPRLHGVFAASAGAWTVVGSGSSALQRCSQFGAPPAVYADQSGFYEAMFSAGEYWHGSFLYVPGSGSQELLRRTAGPTPGDAAYPVTTKDRWLLKCLPSLQNGQGEGFIAISPDGTQYRFDWIVSRTYPQLVKSSPMPEGRPALGGGKLPLQKLDGYLLKRKEVWILPTEITDRHGNKVTYTWSSANPWQLQSIQDAPPAASPRVISFTYLPNTSLISKVSAGGREWNYSYRNTTGGMVLSTLTLPDSSQWTFNLDALTYGGQLVASSSGGCDGGNELMTGVRTGSMTHPSGAVGSFSVDAISHGRSRVFKDCRYGVAGDIATGYAYYPIYTDRFSIVSKSIAGPGLPVDANGQPTTRWSYSYGPANASFAPCSDCPITKTVTVTDPEGDVTRYTFGNEFRVTEGQLLAEEQVERGTGTVVRRTEHTYKAPNTGPWPDPIGQSIQNRGNGDLASRHAPLQQKVITQQGVSFTWSAGAYEQFGKPVRVTRSSSLGYSRTEEYWKQQAPDVWVLGYYDNLGKWVIGLTEARKTTDGVEIERYEYDAATANRMKAWANWQFKQSFTYYTDGTLSSKTDAAGKTTSFSNYKRGLAQTVGYADGTGESAVVDDHGQVASVTNPAGTTTAYEYDAAGRLKKVIYPGGDPVAYLPTVTSYEQRWSSDYGLAPGHWLQTVSTGYAITQRFFDAQWRPVLTRTWDSRFEGDTRRVVVSRYDSDGRKTFESYPQRANAAVGDVLPGTSSSYDALGRIASQMQTGGGTTTTAYLNGFQRQITNPRGFVTTQEFQAFDEPKEDVLTRIFAPEGVTVTIQRDPFGKALSITRAGAGKSATRSYVYDGWQRLCKTIEPETGATVQYLDPVDNVAWRASGLSLPAGNSCDHTAVPGERKVSFSYDARHRLLNTTYGDGTPQITRSYTPDGLLSTVGNNGLNWSYVYNNRRLLKTEQYWFNGTGPGQGWNFHWAIDDHGQVTALTDMMGTVSYSPDAFGRPRQVSGYASNVVHHPNGMVASYTLANGVTHSVSLNARQLPEVWRDDGPDVTVQHERYSYDANGNVTAITDELEGAYSRSMPWYDGLDRLRQANGIWGSGRFEYDALDNLTFSQVGSRALTHEINASTNRLDRLSGSQTVAIGYDANGNVTQRGSQTFWFDVGNRLWRADGKANYSYDAHGRRNWTGWTDGSSQLFAYSMSGKLLWDWHSARSDTRHVYLGDKLIAETNRVTGTSFVSTDALGSPVARTNAAGAVVSRTRYEPYGATAAGLNPTGIGFTGHVNDGDTGLVYMQQRYYEPLAGRFLSVDPVVTDWDSGSSFNRYVYAQNNPYRYTDPDGRNAVAVARLVGTGSFRLATELGAAALGSWIGITLYDVLHQESSDSSQSGDQGCIYCVSGSNTSSGRDYIGSTDNMGEREKDSSDGRDRRGASIVDTYPKGNRDERRKKEQQAINDRGGKGKLDNKRDEIDKKKWEKKGVKPPEKKEEAPPPPPPPPPPPT